MRGLFVFPQVTKENITKTKIPLQTSECGIAKKTKSSCKGKGYKNGKYLTRYDKGKIKAPHHYAVPLRVTVHGKVWATHRCAVNGADVTYIL